MSEEKGSSKLWPILLIAISAIAGGTVTYLYNTYEGRLRAIRYMVASSDAIFPIPKVTGKTLAVTLDSQPIENISSVTIWIGNYEADLTDLPIHIRMAPIDGQPPKLIQIKPDLPPERFEVIPLADLGDDSVRTGYKVKVFNRDQVMRIDALFEGLKAPEITVDTMAKGVVPQKVDQIVGDNRINLILNVGRVLSMFLAGLVLANLIVWGVGVRQKKRMLEDIASKLGPQRQ